MVRVGISGIEIEKVMDRLMLPDVWGAEFDRIGGIEFPAAGAIIPAAGETGGHDHDGNLLKFTFGQAGAALGFLESLF